MLPSLLARDIQQGIKQFLITGFEPADGFFHGVMRRFVDNEPAWMKGPYLQVGLPFRHDSAGRDFFSGFQTADPAYTHQREAWQCLGSDRLAAHTLVATGTGSGKTECFVYPALDHCARARQAGEGGITDRDTMRRHPPDILLTNYTMLDYLLIRPRDRQLWEHNSPTTLRYVVVDELHTFDGAQGTDLALLLRRLQARLHTPAGHLICAGTSATLGDTADTAPLREYARQVFGVPFDAHAVITENRLSAAEFLGDAAIEHVLHPRADLGTVLDPAQYTSPEATLAAWVPVFFPELPVPTDVSATKFRVALGAWLKRHLLFANLIRLLKGRVSSLQELHQQMQGPLPESARAHIQLVLDALLALVAWALAPDRQGPLVTLRLQVWMRELRRMVGKVTSDPARVVLRADKDLKARPEGLYLPLIQCSECHTTGWLSRLAPALR